MTKVDFHILSVNQFDDAAQYVCRLAEKAWRAGHQVLIHCDDVWADRLNEALWSFRPESFVPHGLLTDGEAPVNITSSEACGTHHDVLINLSHQQPNSFSRFKRLIEVVFEEDELKVAKRAHYKFYQERGYPLKNHRV